MKKIFNTKKKIALGGIVFLVVTLIVFNVLKGPDYQTYEISRGDFTKTVFISGKVVPKIETNLSFEVTGEVSTLLVESGTSVKKGDILAGLVTSEISNEIGEYSATLVSEKSTLESLMQGTNSKLGNNREELLNTLKKSYITADDIIRNKVDTFFDKPNSRFPDMDGTLSDYFLREDINQQRYKLQDVLKLWLEKNNTLAYSNVTVTDANYNIANLKTVETLLATISSGTAKFAPTSDVTQAQIDAYISMISQARNTIAGLIVEINQSAESVRGVESEIPVQQAKVQNAQSTLYKIASRNEKYIIRAPFDGIVTRVDIEKGEIAVSGDEVISVMGETGLEIETFIPEVRIVGIRVGNDGIATLDAFGESRKFDVKISHIDPRETEKDGITTYRTLIDFTSQNEDLKPGMTADIEILKSKISDVIVIPSQFVTYEGDNAFVNIKNGNKVEKRQIVVGEKDGKGSVLVESGVTSGEVIAIEK